MLLLLVVTLLTTAPADTTVRPGTYDLEIDYGGMQVAGVLELTSGPHGFAARLEAGPHSPTVKSIVRNAAHLTMTVSAPDGNEVVYRLDFDGDRVTGSFELAGVPGRLKGTRRK